MAYPVDLLNARANKFLLWVPGRSLLENPPQLVLGRYDASAPDSFVELVHQPLVLSADKHDLWELEPRSISPALDEGVYHYWFEIEDSSPEKWGKMQVTDPLAFTVDYRLLRQKGDQRQPAAVIKLKHDGKLAACNPGGTDQRRVPTPPLSSLASNNHLVIYELPASWAKPGTNDEGLEIDVGTFADVKALFVKEARASRRFAGVRSIDGNSAILTELGINALELLPSADARPTGEWGYATAHYLAPDADLGSASDLADLVDTIHARGVRLFTDVVMAFGHDPYGYVDFYKFHLRAHDERDNPDSYQSSTHGQLRDGWGGQLWRYLAETRDTYHPETGEGAAAVHPAWEFHKAALARWMLDFGVGGLRLDSVNNIGNWDFVRAYKERAWQIFNARYSSSSSSSPPDPSKFLVIAEELSMPLDMVHSGTVNALWNERWQERARSLLLGEAGSHDGADFAESVRRCVDCTLDPTLSPRFTDGAQAVNYLTSHDVEGFRKERLYDFLRRSGVWDVGRRAKLGFVLLLTAVGVPMIFAGEEFADQMDRSAEDIGLKQTDPVNYSRRDDGGWRQDLFAYVARLVKFRTKCPALGVDDTDLFHVDRSRGGKIVAWKRGGVGGQKPVVVVANFTDDATPGPEYVIPGWPDRDKAGWREVTQARGVPPEWVGREPLMAWEAKVYTTWQES